MVSVRSKVKEVVASYDCNTSSEYYGALDKAILNLINESARRAKENGRKTVSARDL